MNHDECVPLGCQKAMDCISTLRDPSTGLNQLGSIRSQIADCGPCARAFDIEARLRGAMTPVASELPSWNFRARITQTLASVDLSKLEITDFDIEISGFDITRFDGEA